MLLKEWVNVPELRVAEKSHVGNREGLEKEPPYVLHTLPPTANKKGDLWRGEVLLLRPFTYKAIVDIVGLICPMIVTFVCCTCSLFLRLFFCFLWFQLSILYDSVFSPFSTYYTSLKFLMVALKFATYIFN